MIVEFAALPAIREKHRNERIVFSGGCYDLLHEGHIEALEQRKGLGDKLVVGIVSDKRVAERKGPGRPIRPEAARLTIVAALRSVDYAFMMPMPSEESPTYQVLRLLQPDIFVDGEENRGRWDKEELSILAPDTELVFDDLHRLNSTSAIIASVVSRFQTAVL